MRGSRNSELIFFIMCYVWSDWGLELMNLREHVGYEVEARLGSEDMGDEVGDLLGCETVLIAIDQKVGFEENLPVDALNARIGVVMPNEKGNSLYLLRSEASNLLKELSSEGGSLFFLEVAIAFAIELFALVDSNVVDNSSSLCDEVGLRVETFESCNGGRKVVNFDKVVDAFGIGTVEGYHGLD